MRRIINWWYSISLPKSIAIPATTPQGRERQRYARLTSSFLLLLVTLYIPSGPLMFFDSPPGSSSPFISICLFFVLLTSFLCGRMGWQRLSAIFVISYSFVSTIGVLITNPLDPSLLPIINSLLFSVILAGALMPPIATLITGGINCISILLITTFVPHTAGYTAMMEKGLYSVLIFLPIVLQIGIAVMSYIIMNNLLQTIRRADRAEEIVALQEEMAEYEQLRQAQQLQLEDGIRKIAEVHARIANGDLQARVSLTEGDVLWSIAIPLNNLLNRLQGSIQTEEYLMQTRQAARYVTSQLHQATSSRKPVRCSPTGTILDPVILEINKLMQLYAQSFSQRT